MTEPRPTFADLALAAYCPRKLYYRRRDDDREPPPEVEPIRELAFRYDELLAPSGGSDGEREDPLREAPIAVTPTQYRSNLGRAKARFDAWDTLADPADRDVPLAGRECRGVAHKVLAAPLVPAVISTGTPPDSGVWTPLSVRAVAAAKALAWERASPVERAFVEFPAHGVIREVSLTTRRKAAYRRALRAVRSLDGPPPRLRGSNKCESCEYATTCGVRTRTLGSIL